METWYEQAGLTNMVARYRAVDETDGTAIDTLSETIPSTMAGAYDPFNSGEGV